MRIIGGLLLLSATNTAINGLMSIVYVMSRDGELPPVLPEAQPLRRAVGRRDRRRRRAGARAALQPRPRDARGALRDRRRRRRRDQLHALRLPPAAAQALAQGADGRCWASLLIAIWVTLAFTKLHALVFVTHRAGDRPDRCASSRATPPQRRPKPSLLRQAIIEQLTPGRAGQARSSCSRTAGSDALADAALAIAQGTRTRRWSSASSARSRCPTRSKPRRGSRSTPTRPPRRCSPTSSSTATSTACRSSPSTTPGTNAAELIAEHAAINGVNKVLIGTSRRGALHHLIKGSFQQQLEILLPPEIPVQVLTLHDPSPEPEQTLGAGPPSAEVRERVF